MIIISQGVRILPFVHSDKRGIVLGETVRFNLTPPKGEAHELHSIHFAIFFGLDGELVNLYDPVWAHSIFRISSDNKRITQAPLFRLADPQLYPLVFRGVFWKSALTLASEQDAQIEIFTNRPTEKPPATTGYSIMLIVDMMKQEPLP